MTPLISSLKKAMQIDPIKIRTPGHTQQNIRVLMKQLFFNKTRSVVKSFRLPQNSMCKFKLKEFQAKFMYRIIVTKRGACRYGIQSDDDFLHNEDKDSNNHTFSDCVFAKIISQEVVSWFNVTNRTQFNPPWKRNCSVLLLNHLEKNVTKKFSYTLLSVKYYN